MNFKGVKDDTFREVTVAEIDKELEMAIRNRDKVLAVVERRKWTFCETPYNNFNDDIFHNWQYILYRFYVKLHDIRVLFSEFEWNRLKKEWKIWKRGAAEFQIFHDFWRRFHENSEKSTRMSAISDKQHNLTELSMLRCSFCSAALYTTVKNLRNCEQFEKLWIISNCSL